MTTVIPRHRTPRLSRRQAARHPITIRPLRPEDGAALVAMHARCSPGARYGRWHGWAHNFPSAYLAALLTSAAQPPSATTPQLANAAWRGDELIGFASLGLVTPDVREIGVLVTDAWQHHGIGTALLEALAAQARQLGITTLRAEMLAEDAELVRVLRRLGPVRSTTSHDVVTARVLLSA